MITFLIEDTSLDSFNVERLKTAIQDLGQKFICMKYRPFGGTDYDAINPAVLTNPVILFGSLNLVKEAPAKAPNLRPFVWNDWEALSCVNYYDKYGGLITQKDYQFIYFGDITEDFVKDALFIRPNTNDKCFSGGVVSRENFGRWSNNAINYDVTADTLCVIAKPQKINAEYRLIISHRKVITGSMYRENGQQVLSKIVPRQVFEFAEIAVRVYSPLDFYVMDIAEIDGEYSVLEIGCLNAAGLYECNIDRIVEEIVKYYG